MEWLVRRVADRFRVGVGGGEQAQTYVERMEVLMQFVSRYGTVDYVCERRGIVVLTCVRLGCSLQ